MSRYRIAPAGPGAVDAWGLHVPPDGIERELDGDLLAMLSGDAQVTVEPAEEPSPETPPPAPGKRAARRRD